jgi:hypothetical protein
MITCAIISIKNFAFITFLLELKRQSRIAVLNTERNTPFWARLQKCEKRLLASSCLSVCPSVCDYVRACVFVCPSVRKENFSSHLTNFHEI